MNLGRGEGKREGKQNVSALRNAFRKEGEDSPPVARKGCIPSRYQGFLESFQVSPMHVVNVGRVEMLEGSLL